MRKTAWKLGIVDFDGCRLSLREFSDLAVAHGEYHGTKSDENDMTDARLSELGIDGF